mmetsp:Transcript_139238/g.277614  ORF Transcript_139238/g.277614 Transcript_139238/m.277614 type:complete len:618 (+) Transcript_139238:165-2018(+)
MDLELPDGAVEILEGRLFWAAIDGVPSDTENTHYFSIDDELIYEPFCADFGPLNLAMVYRYCRLVDAKFSEPMLVHRQIVHCCSDEAEKRANAALLICAYQVIVLRFTAEEAFQPFVGYHPPFVGFRDALPRPCNFRLTLQDCLEGLERSIELGWFDVDTFDIEAYEYLDSVENCDGSWVIPDKFLAFAGPASTSKDSDGLPAVTPEDCVSIFKRGGVSLVIRLNRKDYDRRRFVDHGIRHVDLYFPDGSCPPQEIISKFLCIAESEPGAIAVHCKAGLGRTCTLIGLYAMKHYHFPARAFMGWNRICRPGSVLGPQQQFLVDMQDEMFNADLPMPRTLSTPVAADGQTLSFSPQGCTRMSGGCSGATREPVVPLRSVTAEQQQADVGQGERLCGAKRSMRMAALPPEPIAEVAAPQTTSLVSAKVPPKLLEVTTSLQPQQQPQLRGLPRTVAAKVPTSPQLPPARPATEFSMQAASQPPQPLQRQPQPPKVLLEQGCSAPSRPAAAQAPALRKVGPTLQPALPQHLQRAAIAAPHLQPAPRVMLGHSMSMVAKAMPLDTSTNGIGRRTAMVVRQGSAALFCHTVGSVGRPRSLEHHHLVAAGCVREQSPRNAVSAH